ncbi:MAG: hypothetical protein ACPKOI_03270 [Pleomorphochaeta sp.]
MKRFGFKDFFIKPILLSVVTFFIIFFFFPSFSTEYLNVGFSTSSDSLEKVESLSKDIMDKTGQSLDDIKDQINTDDLSNLVNTFGE